MSYNPTFTRGFKGMYDAERAFLSLVQGEGAYRLSDEFNEAEWLKSERVADIFRAVTKSGVVGELSTVTTNAGWNSYFKFGDQRYLIDGYFLRVDKASGEDSGLNRVELSAPGSGNRDDIVFLEVWAQEVKHLDSIYYFGCVNAPTVTNNLQDTRVGAETCRRIQIRSRIRVGQGVSSVDGVPSQGSSGSPDGDNYGEYGTDDRVFVAESESSSFGVVYAFPLFLVNITNSGVVTLVEDLRRQAAVGVGPEEIEDLRLYLEGYADGAASGVQENLDTHETKTGGIHGVGGGDAVESVSGASEKVAIAENNAITVSKEYTDTHEVKTTGVHGVGGSNVESTSGAQTKANTAESNANGYTDTHEVKTTGVHGVGGSPVESVAGAQTKADSAESSANQYTDGHEVKTSDVHGVGTSDVESKEGAQTKANIARDSAISQANIYTNDHEVKTTGVHGVGGSPVESVDGATTKANNAQTNAIATANAYTDTHEGKSSPHTGHVYKSGDTMSGNLIASNNTQHSFFKVRNIYLSTSGPDPGLGGEGDIWFRYVL